jgi:hypothetical protein
MVNVRARLSLSQPNALMIKRGLLVVPGHECLLLGVKIGRAARVFGPVD